MPRVPVLQRRVAGQPPPAVQPGITAPDFGGLEAEVIETIGRGISQVGQAAIGAEQRQAVFEEEQRQKLERLAAEAQKKNDQTFALSGSNTLADTMRAQKSDLLNLKGKDAVGIFETARTGIEKEYNSIRAGLQNDDQRRLYDEKNFNSMKTYLNDFSTYERTQRDTWQKAEGAAGINNAVLDGIGTISPDALDEAKADIKIGISQLNVGDEQAEQIFNENVSAIHEGRIDWFLANDLIEEATEYYKHPSVKKEILPDKRDDIDTRIKVDTTDKESQIRTDEIMATIDTTTDSQRMAKAREIKDPQVRDATVKRVDARNKELDTQKKRQGEVVRQDLMLEVKNAASYSDAIDIANSAADTDVEKKADLVVELNKLADFYFKEPNTPDVVTDRAQQAKLLEDIEAGKFNSLNQLLPAQTFLSPTHYDQAQKLLQGKLNQTNDLTYATTKTAYEIIKGKAFNVDNDKQALEFSRTFDYVQQQLIATGKKGTLAEVKKLSAQSLMDGEQIKGGGFFVSDPDMSYTESIRQGVSKAWLPFLIDDEEELIIEEIKQYNLSVPASKAKSLKDESIRSWKKYSPDWMGIVDVE
jgi:hypothetical protein